MLKRRSPDYVADAIWAGLFQKVLWVIDLLFWPISLSIMILYLSAQPYPLF